LEELKKKQLIRTCLVSIIEEPSVFLKAIAGLFGRAKFGGRVAVFQLISNAREIFGP
jgi:hypothetical protein